MAVIEGQGLMNELLLDDSASLQKFILEALVEKCGCESLFGNESQDRVRSSSVMLLLSQQVAEDGAAPEICLILNKRSKEVLQGGDLCCPGGTINSRLDSYLARILWLPGSPLSRWPHWCCLHKNCPDEARLLSKLLATALREGWEEIRLNPLKVRFLGPLSSQCLILFRRVIHPMVGWVSRQKRFSPNWEVEKIVTIPLRSFVNHENYAVYRLDIPSHLGWRLPGKDHEFPCFLYRHQNNQEVLWGVTYRIVMSLLEMVFGFRPPDAGDLPRVHGVLEECYVQGRQGNADRSNDKAES
jgi:hypothetical protein